MWHTLDIYRRLLILEWRSQTSYRTSFWLDVFGVAFNSLIAFGTIALVLQRFGGIAGWSVGEVAFLFGMVETAFGIMHLLFAGFDPPDFGLQIRLGRFDQILLRPVGATIQVLGSDLALRHLGRTAMGAVIFGLALTLVPVDWTLVKLLYLPVVFAGLVGFFGGLFVLGATVTFWTVESIEFMNIFTYGGSEMMSYPMSVYQDWLRRFFTYILPAIFLNYYPALFFLNKPDPFHMPGFVPFLAPLVGAGVMVVAGAFWRYGMRHYQSTGT